MVDQTEGKVSLSVDSLIPGWLVDRDIFVGSDVLIAAGVTLTPAIIASLERRSIRTIQVSRSSELINTAESQQSDALTGMIAKTNEVYEKHNIETAIPDQVLEEATDQVEEFFHQIEVGEKINFSHARDLSHQLVSLFSSRSHLAIKLLDLDSFDRYTYRHSINVGILFILIASEWVSSTEELEELVLGAILHDLGKARVGNDIINKKGALSDSEWVTMRKHPIWSAELLADADSSPDAIAIARWHHERLDGKGYPDGIAMKEQSRFIRLSAVCDVYDALTTKRSYKAKMGFAKAIDIILAESGTHFDPDISHAFIRRIGRYPVGCFVTLSTGEVAVVLRINPSAISRPVVSRIIDASGNNINQGEELDLTECENVHIQAVIGGQRVT